MNVILLNKVENLGNIGDIVKVKPGFGRNFLIPQGRAVIANEKNRVDFEKRRAEFEKVAREALSEAQGRAAALSTLAVISISHRAGEEGKLFGSVGTREISDAISAGGKGVVAKQEVRLPAGALRQTGEYDIELHLHPEVNVTVKIVIAAEAE
ncbi:MAG: 50S ribosomal protein L9 [Gammaproteobacteria bacterium]|nr:50S ribosomal protein L9 [Gammaproteobacteria bacterium]